MNELVEQDPGRPIAAAAPEVERRASECELSVVVPVLDEEGTIRWSYVSPIGVNPGADGILNALEGLKSKETSQ